eukprot:TRINITY_DN19007_c0_g2_i1.p1 TRINITY_DN19007_c0_g2~~TRINITY_DN19007_c0_g2_i1.p1  ORF type:complete len:144 (+),score=24.45 TRINITY_DN19007_c0_g2_i1:125-556(+)
MAMQSIRDGFGPSVASIEGQLAPPLPVKPNQTFLAFGDGFRNNFGGLIRFKSCFRNSRMLQDMFSRDDGFQKSRTFEEMFIWGDITVTNVELNDFMRDFIGVSTDARANHGPSGEALSALSRDYACGHVRTLVVLFSGTDGSL